MRYARSAIVVLSLWTAAACASMGMNSVQKLNQLSPGMSSEEVEAILGEPASSELTKDKLVQKYSLHENWKGFVPYFMVFDKDSRQLEAWYEDEEGYQRSQQQMGETFRPLMEGQSQGGQGSVATPTGPNDPELQSWITGNYYYFSSSAVVSASSERSFTLCVNGQFSATGEFSASSAGSWGAASQGGNAGAWTISGNRQAGTITLSYGDGSTKSVPYRVGSQEEQTMYFDGVLYAYAGVASCQ
jgi:hypothetical protein